MRIIYIHGFFGQDGSPLGEKLKVIAKQRGQNFDIALWDSGTIGDVFSNCIDAAVGSKNIISGIVNVARSVGQGVLENWLMSLDQVNMAARVLANHLTKIAPDENIALVGFSLGAQVILRLLELIKNRVILESIHSITICGAAADCEDVPSLNRLHKYQPGFKVTNIFSHADQVLDIIYPVGTYFGSAAGRYGFKNDQDDIVNLQVNVGHLEYDQVADLIYYYILKRGTS